MTRRKRGDRGPVAPAQRSARRGAPPARPILVAAAVVALAVAAWLFLREPHPRTPAPDPAHALSEQDAYREAVRLANQDRRTESLPYFRRALEGPGGEFWEVRYNYGLTLASNAIQYVPRVGEPRLAVRSSVTRVRLVQAAMTELDRASRLAPNPKARAQVLARFANTVAVWGFPWETLDLMRRTEYADTTDPAPAVRAHYYLAMMRDPPKYVGDFQAEQAIGNPARERP